MIKNLINNNLNTSSILLLFFKQIFFYLNSYTILNNNIYIFLFKLLVLSKSIVSESNKIITDYIFFNKNLEIFKHILTIKTISKTTKKGRTRRFKVILIIGAFSNWIGIGTGKDTYLNEAIEKAYLNAFTKIFYIKTTSVVFNKKLIKYKASKLIVNTNFSKYNNIIKTPLWLVPILESLNIKNISCKQIGSRNRLNNLMSIIKLYC